MKAIRIHNYGGPEVLRYEDAPRPTPGPGELLIKVEAASVNPVDWKTRAGYLKDFMPHTLPFIPGWDASGVIKGCFGEEDHQRSGLFDPSLVEIHQQIEKERPMYGVPARV
jgi:NADPH:quinone reductase-like Zn-dependent oxidoreductase